jgi:hypothetical protein
MSVGGTIMSASVKVTSGRPHSALRGAYLNPWYFGLTNSPAIFQTMMNEIFQDLITEGVVSVYLDDILIFTGSLEEHRRITCLVLDRMHEHKLYLRPEKCEFEKTKIKYLSVIISHNKVEMDLVKIAGVADWPMRSSHNSKLTTMHGTPSPSCPKH